MLFLVKGAFYVMPFSLKYLGMEIGIALIGFNV